MGPETAVRALHKAVSLGADRSVHLSDDALAGSDVAATGYALAQGARAREPRPRPARPAVRRRRVLHDRRRRRRAPADAVADAGHQDGRRRGQAALRAPGGVRLRHRRGRRCPPSSRSATRSTSRATRRSRRSWAPRRSRSTSSPQATRTSTPDGRRGGLQRPLRRLPRPRRPRRPAQIIEDEDTNETVEKIVAWLDERKLISWPDILVYALHYDGAFNKNSLGAVSEAATLAGELGGEAHAIVVGDERSDRRARRHARQLRRDEGLPRRGPRGPRAAGRRRDGARSSTANGHDYALFGGGLLGFEIGAGLAARLDAGVTMEVTQVDVEDGKLVAERPILRRLVDLDLTLQGTAAIIIGRLNAFESRRPAGAAADRGRRRRATRRGRRRRRWSSAASSAAPT